MVTAGSDGEPGGLGAAGGAPDTVDVAVAVLLGAGALAWRVADRVTRPARGVFGGVAGGLLAALVQPVAAGQAAAAGRALRAQWADLLARTVAHAAREVVAVVLPALDLTELVLKHVDLNRIAAALDLDAAVARVDLDAAVARVDIDAAVARVDIDTIVARIELDAIAAQLDIEAIAARLDLDRLAAGIDVEAIVDRVDIGAIVDRVNIDAIVERVDVEAAVGRVDADRIVARVDLDAVVARLDLVGIAQTVIDAIDLPEIVRESTGALSSDAVRAVRAESKRADDRIAGVFDRLLRRNQPGGPPAGAPALP